jgi:2-C-methyl-D-erythritol 2,4-cyclodiphosphate synthase
MRIGQGFDAHRLVPARSLMLGGIEVPYERGLEGHSDGDVLLHAIADALLGALGEGDLGAHFPSSDERWRGVASSRIVSDVVEKMRSRGFGVCNLDATIIAQAPRLAAYQPAMRSQVAVLLDVPPEAINLKVTSTDHLGALGRAEGIAAMAVVLLVEKGHEGMQERPEA